jgi:hypothetical protein
LLLTNRPSWCRCTTRVRLRIMNRPAGFSAIAAANAARASSSERQIRQRLVAVALEPFLDAKGIRDIASGLFAAIFIAYGGGHPLGWFMLAAAIIPIADAAIVLRQVAFGVHDVTAAVMLIISGLLLFQ